MKKNKIALYLATTALLIPSALTLSSANSAIKPLTWFEYIRINPYIKGGDDYCMVDVKVRRRDKAQPIVAVYTSDKLNGTYTMAENQTGAWGDKELEVSLYIADQYLYEGVTYFQVFTFYIDIYGPKLGTTVAVNESKESYKYVFNPKYHSNLTFNNFFYTESDNRNDFRPGEVFDFSTWDSLYLEEYYYRIDVTQLSFGYESLYANNKLGDDVTATLYITDPGTYFGHLRNKVSSNKLYFELDLVDNGDGTYSFDSNYTFFVDPETFITYPYQRKGTFATKFIYLPKNLYKRGLEFDYQLIIKNLGVNKITMDYSYTRIIGNKMVGNCVDSGFCVIGEESTEHFQGGTITEVSK